MYIFNFIYQIFHEKNLQKSKIYPEKNSLGICNGKNKCFRMIISHLKSEMKPYPDRIDIRFGIGYLISQIHTDRLIRNTGS